MAHRRRDSRDRRQRGGGALDIQGTLGTLLRTTLEQVGVVKDVVERQARSSLANLDQVMLQRKRRDALVQLGEMVHELARNRELGVLADHPGVAETLAELEDIDARLDEEGELGAAQAEAVSSADWRPPASSRPAAATRATGDAGPRVWRPVIPDDEDAAGEAAEAGTETRRSQHTDRIEPAPASAAAPASAPAAAAAPASDRPRRRRGRQGDAGGGIAFMSDALAADDEDLSEYMHEDDVPRKD